MNNLQRFIGSGKNPLMVFFVAAFTVLSGSSCSTVGPPATLTDEHKAALIQRVTERWQFMEKKDFAASYVYTTPKYREVFPKALYVNKFSYAVDMELTGVEVLHYDARAAVASVAVGVMSKPAKQTSVASNALGALPLTLNEKWIFLEGEWWHSAKD